MADEPKTHIAPMNGSIVVVIGELKPGTKLRVIAGNRELGTPAEIVVVDERGA